MSSMDKRNDATASRFATQAIVEAIADERPVDWTPAERALGNEDRALTSLRLIDDVARAFRSSTSTTAAEPPENPLFRWGPLAIIESLGQGMTGDVYRAFDPALQRSVALKLRVSRDPASDPANAQLLDEARRLARIRHQNVLAVFGAAVHDGRAGIWAELIDGRTLAEIVGIDGPLGASEAIAICLDVCRALIVVHEAGLVHGDVKAENVMRERGGRIVLMDFGASGRSADLADRTVVAGTRRCLPPEILSGDAAPDEKTDLYSLAVLIYFLLTGKYPVDDANDNFVPLRQRRPDLPDGLIRLVDGVLAREKGTAIFSATQFYNALADLRSQDSTPRKPRWRANWLAAAAIVTCVVGAAWFIRDTLWPPGWSAMARFIDPASGNAIVDGTAVRIGDTLAAHVETTRDTWAYVLNEDADGALTVLFPIEGLDQRNPLPARTQVLLPGTIAGKSVNWEISSPSASEEFVLILADRPLSGFSDRLTAIASAQTADLGDVRGATRLRSASAGSIRLEGVQLRELVEQVRQETAQDEAMAPIRIVTLRLPHVAH